MEHIPPTGFRFYPTEEELVGFYLHNQLEGQRNDINRVIPVIDINGIEPWNLPPLAGELCRGETEQWFFFAPRQEREARGGRINRTTASGYWKATGSPGYVYSSDNKVIGVKKTMVFYKGRAPFGRKTKWKLHEYRAIDQVSNHSPTAIPKLRHEFSLCRVYVISGSFGAFDRRPPEVPGVVGLRGAEGSSSAQQLQEGGAARVANESSSYETSHSGGRAGGGDQSGAVGSSTGGGGGTNWNASGSGGVDEEEPLWDWEQFNWL